MSEKVTEPTEVTLATTLKEPASVPAVMSGEEARPVRAVRTVAVVRPLGEGTAAVTTNSEHDGGARDRIVVFVLDEHIEGLREL